LFTAYLWAAPPKPARGTENRGVRGTPRLAPPTRARLAEITGARGSMPAPPGMCTGLVNVLTAGRRLLAPWAPISVVVSGFALFFNRSIAATFTWRVIGTGLAAPCPAPPCLILDSASRGLLRNWWPSRAACGNSKRLQEYKHRVTIGSVLITCNYKATEASKASPDLCAPV